MSATLGQLIHRYTPDSVVTRQWKHDNFLRGQDGGSANPPGSLEGGLQWRSFSEAINRTRHLEGSIIMSLTHSGSIQYTAGAPPYAKSKHPLVGFSRTTPSLHQTNFIAVI
jgi:hypothetical protein